MAERDLTQEILRKIQADLTELSAHLEAGFARIENGLARITVELTSSVEHIEQRLLGIEEPLT